MAAQFVSLGILGGNQAYPQLAYLDDADGSLANMDSGSTPSANTLEEALIKDNITITDICIAAATGQTKTTILVNGTRVGQILNANHLASVTNRPYVGIRIGAGSKLSLEQNA